MFYEMEAQEMDAGAQSIVHGVPSVGLGITMI